MTNLYYLPSEIKDVILHSCKFKMGQKISNIYI